MILGAKLEHFVVVAAGALGSGYPTNYGTHIAIKAMYNINIVMGSAGDHLWIGVAQGSAETLPSTWTQVK